MEQYKNYFPAIGENYLKLMSWKKGAVPGASQFE
jgi:hypothetical protein